MVCYKGSRVYLSLHQWDFDPNQSCGLVNFINVHVSYQIAGGLCDNLLTCIVRAWDYNKPIFVAPAMNALMWKNSFTERHLVSVDDLGITLIRPVANAVEQCNGVMAEPSHISATVILFIELQRKRNKTANQ